LALLSHLSHQIAGVDSISLVISLMLRYARFPKAKATSGS
jgi:hypothetical protein